jgi:hypothetical protein
MFKFKWLAHPPTPTIPFLLLGKFKYTLAR